MKDAKPTPARHDDDDADIRAELISRFGLDGKAIEKVLAIMRTANLEFSDAAVRIGVLTREEIEEVMTGVGIDKRSTNPGLIEKAIRRVSNGREIVPSQGEPVSPGPSLVIAHDSDSPRSERLRALRTELLLLNEDVRGANIVAVLSPGAGEGRSQLAAELAIAFAQLGSRTLLVDADLRKPSQHILFGASNDIGLSTAIRDYKKPIYHPVLGLPRMHLLTAGPVPQNPLELLSDGRFEKLISEWRNSYEFLVLDTPPVSQCADGIAIATLAGRVLLLSRAQRTPYKNTREMMRRLTTTQSRILGAVLNHF